MGELAPNCDIKHHGCPGFSCCKTARMDPALPPDDRPPSDPDRRVGGRTNLGQDEGKRTTIDMSVLVNVFSSLVPNGIL